VQIHCGGLVAMLIGSIGLFIFFVSFMTWIVNHDFVTLFSKFSKKRMQLVRMYLEYKQQQKRAPSYSDPDWIVSKKAESAYTDLIASYVFGTLMLVGLVMMVVGIVFF
jgi:flagellar biosynthesis/type III secretory pathway M-ring protein FliF/YscJ